jgi:hypothetical protein
VANSLVFPSTKAGIGNTQPRNYPNTRLSKQSKRSRDEQIPPNCHMQILILDYISERFAIIIILAMVNLG